MNPQLLGVVATGIVSALGSEGAPQSMQSSQIRQSRTSEVQTSEHSGLACPIVRFRKGQLRNVEEPLEIRLCHGPIGARQIKSHPSQ
jgi:hypothetical protein